MKPSSHFQLARACAAHAALVAAGAAALFTSRPAQAEESAYCTKVRERAAGDAALLYWPKLQAQAIKFPTNGAIDLGATTSTTEYQLRTDLSISPLDMYKGTGVERVGEADCRQHEAAEHVQDVLLAGPDFGRLAALRQQAAFLDSRKDALEDIMAKSDARLTAHVVSVLESNELRSRIVVLSRKRIQVAGDIARLEELGLPEAKGTLADLTAAATSSAMEMEERAVHVRSLDPWDVRVSGGVVPQGTPVNWYGYVLVGFNFGAFSRNSHDAKYLEARAVELKHARYEQSAQLGRFVTQMRSAREQTLRELDVVDRERTTLATVRASIEHADAPGGPHALAVIDLDLIALDSDHTYLTALARELSRFDENDHDHP